MSERCPFCDRDTGGQRGHITPRTLPVDVSLKLFTVPVTPDLKTWIDVRTCKRPECRYAARTLPLDRIPGAGA